MEHIEYSPRPLISIAMCVYNPGPFLQPALDSIFAQTYENWELVISDDGSNDGTREKLRALEGHPKVRLFFQEKNLGYVANKNFAHRQARGEYITQLDNDDTCSPDRLEKQLAAMQWQPGLKMVGCGYTRIDEAGETTGIMGERTDRLITVPEPGSYPFWFPSLLVHRSVFETVGYFDSYFAGAVSDDLYWTVRANERFPIGYCSEPLYHYRYSATSITNVLDNDRKLLIGPVLEELFRQRKERGSDWLEEGHPELLARYEDGLRRDGRFMSEQYRIWAAKAIDRNDFAKARQLLWRAFRRWPFSFPLLKSSVYYFRKRLAA